MYKEVTVRYIFSHDDYLTIKQRAKEKGIMMKEVAKALGYNSYIEMKNRFNPSMKNYFYQKDFDSLVSLGLWDGE